MAERSLCKLFCPDSEIVGLLELRGGIIRLSCWSASNSTLVRSRERARPNSVRRPNHLNRHSACQLVDRKREIFEVRMAVLRANFEMEQENIQQSISESELIKRNCCGQKTDGARAGGPFQRAVSRIGRNRRQLGSRGGYKPRSIGPKNHFSTMPVSQVSPDLLHAAPHSRAQCERSLERYPRVKEQNLYTRLLLRSQAYLAARLCRASARW
jgi:hypothetical protein